MFRRIKNIISSWFFRSSLVFLIAVLFFVSINFINSSPAFASEIVSGAISDASVQYGGLQRKIVYASSNWYAFYTNGGQIWYQKSSDGITWGSAVAVGTLNYSDFSPSVWLEGTTIYVAWVDYNPATVEVETIDTANSDNQGTQCTSSSLGTFSCSFGHGNTA